MGSYLNYLKEAKKANLSKKFVIAVKILDQFGNLDEADKIVTKAETIKEQIPQIKERVLQAKEFLQLASNGENAEMNSERAGTIIDTAINNAKIVKICFDTLQKYKAKLQ